jgi:hypothetical protein
MGKKFALSNIMGLGTSNEGFRIQDLLGPYPGALENLSKAASESLKGKPLAAVGTLVPPSLRNAVNMVDSQLKYGKVQFMDKSNNMLMVPGKMEALGYALGLTPTRLARMQEAGQQMKVSGELKTALWRKEADSAAVGLIKNDPSGLMKYVETMRENDPTLDPAALVKDVVDRSIDMMTPKDFMATKTPLGQKAQNRIIAATYPGPFNRQSEIQRLQIRDAAYARLGFPFGIRPSSAEAYRKATMIDQLVATGLAKPEAARQVELMTSQAALRQTMM